MRDDRYYTSASMTTYIHWVLKDRLGLTEKECKQNLCVVSALAGIEFAWRHPMDENRANEGLELRDDFEYETGDFLDKSSGLIPQCSMFEMLAALAIKCENQLMRNSLLGDRTSKWFFEFLDNLGILDCDERDVDHIVDVCNDFMDGRIDMFPLKKKGIKQKNEQIWKQLMAYLNENYAFDVNEDSDMPLFAR